MELLSFIKKLKKSWPKQILALESLAPAKARYRKLKKKLPLVLNRILKAKGLAKLYVHQAQAIEAIRAGVQTAVVSPAASGKTLIYNLPVLESILKNPTTSALYLFPTKALAQDQAKNILEFCAEIKKIKKQQINVEIFDGDTPASRRAKIKRDVPHILISNPDMLHLSLLAHHGQWARFLKNIKYVVVDEAHYYRGVIGTHFAQVMARFKRILADYGARPQFIVLSATLANPDEFLNKLLGNEFKIFSENGAPRGQKHFIFWKPVGSPYQESKKLLLESVAAGFKTIVFTKARKITELIYSWAIEEQPKIRDQISAYRAGYLPKERREIEKKLFNDELRGVVATSALELGIDIGGLDVCILVGYPGTLISTWQRIGRVGRGQQPALIILVGLEDALDHYFLEHPPELFTRQLESALVDDQNLIVAADHLVCAANEKPLERREFLAKKYLTTLDRLVNEGKLWASRDGQKYFSRVARPHHLVNLRSIGASFRIKRADNHQIIGQTDYPKVLHECYPGAIYLHSGGRWLVTEMNLAEKYVLVVPSAAGYYTEARSSETVEIIKVLKKKKGAEGNLYFGEIKVTEIIRSYVKKKISGGGVLDEIPLEMEPHIFETKGLWFEISEKIKDKLIEKNLDFLGGLHAVEHALIGIMPIFVLCDRLDLGGVSYPYFPGSQNPLIFIYDAYPGGIGLTEKAHDYFDQLYQSAFKLIKDCDCEMGCPGCIQSPKCGNGNQPLDKFGAFYILDFLIKNSRSFQEEKPLNPVAALPAKGPESCSDQQKIIFIDLETQKLFSEVGGRFPEKLKLAVGVTYDSLKDKYDYFEESEVFQLLDQIISADLVVGFNIHSFDWLVLKPYFKYDLAKINSFDVLEYIYNKYGFRISLDSLAKTTLGAGKSADGLQAVDWYQKGQIKKIKEYCRHDVEIIKDLYYFGKKFKYLLFEKNGQLLRLPVEW